MRRPDSFYKLYRLLVVVIGAAVMLYGLKTLPTNTEEGTLGSAVNEIRTTGELKMLIPPPEVVEAGPLPTAEYR